MPSFPHFRTMSYLPDGRYRIVLASPSAPPPSPVGVNDDGGPTSPVVSGGKDNIWTARNVESDPERQTLTLEQTVLPLLSQQAGDNVVVGITPPGIWRIQKQGDDTYSIEVHNRYWPTRAWTLNSTQPGTEVTVEINEDPGPEQLWNFIPVHE
ncbi:hypothetical protein HD554DRAFT_722194 [Boletus coccyginus]|nr:hypothetical protein HD554DRAFT_722194 [Boletus coccyginus]